MDIGQEIKQKKFKSNNAKALINLQYTTNKLLQSLNHIFKPKGLQSQHFNILRIIKGKHPNPVCPGEIKDVMLDKGRDLTRLLDRLEKDNLLTRHVNDANRRMININLTEKGMSILDDLSIQLDKWYEINQKLTEDEAEQLSNLLDKLRG